MDGPYRLTTRKTAKDRIKGHWYYYYFKGELELRYCIDGKRIREMNKLKKSQKQYRETHKEEREEYQKKYGPEHYKKNLDEIRARHKRNYAIYYPKNRDRIAKRKKIFNSKPSNKKKRNKRKRERYASDMLFRLSVNLRRSLSQTMSRASASKNAHTIEYSCCSVAFLYAHLEKQFTDGMTWENYGEWHIDHRRPSASFNLNNEDEIYMCQHYTNFQPMWARENIVKGNYYDSETFEYEWKGRVIGWRPKIQNIEDLFHLKN